MEDSYKKIATQDLLNSSSAIWLQLPSAPTFMCIMKTIEGKPAGIPIWSSFENKPYQLSLENDAVSSTILSLSQNLKTLAPGHESTKDNVMRISYGGRTWSIYLPAKNSDFQISFIVAFEDRDMVAISDADRDFLTRRIVKRLGEIDELVEICNDPENPRLIEIDDSLYKKIYHTLSSVVSEWDKKRIKYIEKESKKERDKIMRLAEERMKQELID